MKLREMSPLTDMDQQQMLIDGKLYMRARGDTKFKLADSSYGITGNQTSKAETNKDLRKQKEEQEREEMAQ